MLTAGHMPRIFAHRHLPATASMAVAEIDAALVRGAWAVQIFFDLGVAGLLLYAARAVFLKLHPLCRSLIRRA